MTIQSVVEKLHRQRVMNKDSLANKVEEAFFKFEGYTILAAIARLVGVGIGFNTG